MLSVERVFGAPHSRFVDGDSSTEGDVVVLSAAWKAYASAGRVYIHTESTQAPKTPPGIGAISGVRIQPAVAYVCAKMHSSRAIVCSRLLAEEKSDAESIRAEIARRGLSATVEDIPAEDLFPSVKDSVSRAVSTIRESVRDNVCCVIFGCPSQIARAFARRAGVSDEEFGGEDCASALKLGVRIDAPRVIGARLPRRSDRDLVARNLPDARFVWIPYADSAYNFDFEAPDLVPSV